MKTLAMAAMVVMAGTASARNIDFPAGTVVPVCVEGVSSGVALYQAKGLASKMFATAGVNIEWRSWSGCPADGIRITMSQNTKPADHPRAYAYALPFEGTHIVVFLDRVTESAGPRALPFLLAHVLVHEVTHILEGTCRHSETGVLKAVFTHTDISEMELHALPFAAEDLELIHNGLEARRVRTLQVNTPVAAASLTEAAVQQ